MNFTITSSVLGKIQLEPVKEEPRRNIMPGSVVLGSKTKDAFIEIRMLEGRKFKIFHTSFLVREEQEFAMVDSTAGIYVHFSLKNESEGSMVGFGDWSMSEGQYNFMYANDSMARRKLRAGTEYISFDILFTPELLEQYLEPFPMVGTFLEDVSAGRTSFMLFHPGKMSMHMKRMIYEIIHTVYPAGLEVYHLGNKVNELLLHVLQEFYMKNESILNLSQENLETVYHATNYMRENMHRHFTVSEMAKSVGISEPRLRNSFKMIFRSHIAEYLLQMRMQNAYSLLFMTNKPIKEIARIVGYQNMQNFLTAYRKFFGITPGAIRKRNA